MKKSFLIISLIIIISGYTNALADLPYKGTGTYGDIQDSLPVERNTDYNNKKSLTSPQIDYKIFYGLNESHSRSWVRENSDGVVGIVYFQRFEGSPDQGTLIYKTIQLDGSANSDSVTVGSRLEKAVLLYDSLAGPHIFVARSNNIDQVIDHYYKNESDLWQSETITHFNNVGGRFIYELSADTGPDHSFHLLILKTRSDIDSDDYWDAWLDSYLFYMTNENGTWKRHIVYNYDMAYTYDHYIKSSSRQDIKIDNDGFAHVTFSEQIDASDDPSRLLYATNKSGIWQIEVALNYDFGARDDAGWFPSLCLDNYGVPHIACMYINRVYTYSAVYCKLYFLKRLGNNNWQAEVIAEHDDGYFGSDGRNYTGALSHLIFDSHNTPHIIFSDIASSHWYYQRLCVGNIRYGVFEGGNWNVRTDYSQPSPNGYLKDTTKYGFEVFEEGTWNYTTIYRQPLPTAFMSATEMHGMCLVVSDLTDTIRIIGQELEVVSENEYTNRLVEFAFARTVTDVDEDSGTSLADQKSLSQNYPNPFNSGTLIEFNLSHRSWVTLSIYNILGQRVKTLVENELPAGNHSIFWDGTDSPGNPVSTGIYLYRLETGDITETRKMIILK